jgi:hypothetical protein
MYHVIHRNWNSIKKMKYVPDEWWDILIMYNEDAEFTEKVVSCLEPKEDISQVSPFSKYFIVGMSVIALYWFYRRY